MDSNSKKDDLKGRAKQAVGDLTRNRSMKREGQADQAGASAKSKVNSAVDSVKGIFRRR
jgi:uncharacterized protein YjbJ (UPF0337 family)